MDVIDGVFSITETAIEARAKFRQLTVHVGNIVALAEPKTDEAKANIEKLRKLNDALDELWNEYGYLFWEVND